MVNHTNSNHGPSFSAGVKTFEAKWKNVQRWLEPQSVLGFLLNLNGK